LAKVI